MYIHVFTLYGPGYSNSIEKYNVIYLMVYFLKKINIIIDTFFVDFQNIFHWFSLVSLFKSGYTALINLINAFIS